MPMELTGAQTNELKDALRETHEEERPLELQEELPEAGDAPATEAATEAAAEAATEAAALDEVPQGEKSSLQVLLSLTSEEQQAFDALADRFGPMDEGDRGTVKIKGDCPSTTCTHTKTTYSCPSTKL